MEGHTTIPFYIEATSKDELIKKMFEKASKEGSFMQYSTPVKEGNKWVVWYNFDARKELKEFFTVKVVKGKKRGSTRKVD